MFAHFRSVGRMLFEWRDWEVWQVRFGKTEKFELQASKLWEAEEGIEYLRYLYSIGFDDFQWLSFPPVG